MKDQSYNPSQHIAVKVIYAELDVSLCEQPETVVRQMSSVQLVVREEWREIAGEAVVSSVDKAEGPTG